jgi:hypothetical protein
VRERFHPAAFEERLARRRAAAAEAAAAVASDLESGRLDPASDGFNQGALDAAEGGGGASGEQPPPPPSALLWAPGRAAGDLKAALRLAAVLDDEKGIASNPLLPDVPEAEQEAEAGKGALRRGGRGACRRRGGL